MPRKKSTPKTEDRYLQQAAEQAGHLQTAFLAWYRKHARDLPWRRTRDPYCIWLSEIILQQTRIEAGTAYYERFLEHFPTVQALAAADEDSILKLWEGLGYYSRARNLHKAAKHVVDSLDGHLPTSAAAWRKLPGIGPYTAGAIASIAFEESTPLVDGNVKRVFARLFGIDLPIDTPAADTLFWQIAEILVPANTPGDFNQSLMELGATVCVPRSPRCDTCPVQQWCVAYAQNTIDSLPQKSPKKKVPHRKKMAAAICKNGTYLLVRRPSDGFLGGLWEFPTCDMPADPATFAAFLHTAFGIEVTPGNALGTANHAYSHFTVESNLILCSFIRGRVHTRDHVRSRWVTKHSIDDIALSTLDRKLRNILLQSGK